MIVERTSDDARRFDCLGYASFVEKLQDEGFRRWFAPLEAAITNVGIGDLESQRLARLQNALLDLEEFLYGSAIPERRRIHFPQAPGPAGSQ